MAGSRVPRRALRVQQLSGTRIPKWDEILTHAGRVSHDDAMAKAELEYDRFADTRAALPAPVEAHFEEAIRDVKLLEKAHVPTARKARS